MENKIAVIRISGQPCLREDVRRTLNQLRLYKKFHCVVLPNNPVYLGMVKKVKDYVTWGEINEETETKLNEKKSEYFINKGKKELRKYYRLCPPRRGFERKGTKVSYQNKGALGYRKEKINDLILRMI